MYSWELDYVAKNKEYHSKHLGQTLVKTNNTPKWKNTYVGLSKSKQYGE